MMNIGTIALASKVTVYVPSTTNTDSKANTTAHVNATASLLSKLFGGRQTTMKRPQGLFDFLDL